MFESPRGRDGSGGEASSTFSVPRRPGGYAKGWGVNEAGTWWHEGSLPGSTAIVVRTSSGFCWAAVANTRDRRLSDSSMLSSMFKLLREMVGVVQAWRA